MKKLKFLMGLFLVWVFVLPTPSANAQSQENKVEVGASLIKLYGMGIYYDNYSVDRGPVELMNAFMLRYQKGKKKVRLTAGYASSFYLYNQKGEVDDGPNGHVFNQNIHVGGGLQFNLGKKSPFYQYNELLYRRHFAQGIAEDSGWGSDFSFNRKSHAIDVITGLGSTVYLGDKVFISPECGVMVSFISEQMKYTYHFRDSRSSQNTQVIPYPFLRLQAGIRF